MVVRKVQETVNPLAFAKGMGLCERHGHLHKASGGRRPFAKGMGIGKRHWRLQKAWACERHGRRHAGREKPLIGRSVKLHARGKNFCCNTH